MRTFGVLEDPRCLPFLLWMSEYGGHALKWATGSVTVDTGAAGDVDQRAAEAAWIARTIERHGGNAPESFVEEVLDLHAAWAEERMCSSAPEVVVGMMTCFGRSEGRRVGEEGRSRWAPDH